jgi:acetolactate synthase-1/2/3 large subunit
MGYGIPAAVGAKAARPDKHVICIDGDGCFQMTAKELLTSVREDLPIIVVILNNGYLGMVTQWQDMFFSRRRSHTTLSTEVPDCAGVAQALGGLGIRVETEAEFEAALEQALSSNRTVVIDCRTDPTEQCFPMILPGGAAVDVVAYPEELAETRVDGQAVGAALTRDAL